MKAIVKEKEKNERVVLPCLMKSTESNSFILATNENGSDYSGLEISDISDTGVLEVVLFGEHRYPKKYWKPFNGTITLSNDL